MKFEKRLIALLLVFVLLLAGCANGQLSATDDTTTGTTAGTTEYIPPTDETTKPSDPVDETTGRPQPEIHVTCQYIPETVDNPDDLPVLKWVCLTDLRNRVWNEAAAVELNQMLEDRNMPFRVQFALLTTDQWLSDTQKMFHYPEAQEALKEADLIYGGMNKTSLVEYLAPITEYVTGTAEPTLKNAVAHKANWLDATVDGEIYGYGTLPKIAESDGWQVDPELLKAAGLTEADLRKNFWEMDDVLAKMYEANGKKPFLYLQDGLVIREESQHQNIEMILSMSPLIDTELRPQSYCADGSFFGVDYSGETPVAVNYLETEVSRKLTEAALRYKEANYTTESPEAQRLRYKNLYTHSMLTYTTEEGDLCIPVTEAYYIAPQMEGFVSGVAAISQHKAEAVSLLNLIAEDEEFQLHFFYGKEGRDYKIVNGYYEQIIQEDSSNYSLDFLSPRSYFCGMTANLDAKKNWSHATKNWGYHALWEKTRLETYQDILDHCTYAYPIYFDYSSVKQEVDAMRALFEQKYSKSFAEDNMTEIQRQRLVEDLKTAGSDKVLAELQRQLTEWQKNNPDWQLKPEE